jgi:SAM-dependent methyltransferase
MIFTNPQSRSYEMRVRERGVLDRYFNPDRLRRIRLLSTFHLSYLQKFSTGRRVLDFGCGEGTFVRQAKDEGWSAVGVDLNEALIDAANVHWGFNDLYKMTLEELLKTGWKFDAIYSNQVFEHLRRPVEVGVALTTLLAPGGLIYLEVPNANRIREFVSRGQTLDPTSHFNHFTVETLSRLIERIGCVPIFRTGAPGMFRFWTAVVPPKIAIPLARVSRQILPGLGTGACVIGKVNATLPA